jgi:hypothetical protein
MMRRRDFLKGVVGAIGGLVGVGAVKAQEETAIEAVTEVETLPRFYEWGESLSHLNSEGDGYPSPGNYPMSFHHDLSPDVAKKIVASISEAMSQSYMG